MTEGCASLVATATVFSVTAFGVIGAGSTAGRAGAADRVDAISSVSNMVVTPFMPDHPGM